MNKIWLIIQREFLTRVQKKSFLITTILVPLIFPAIFIGLGYLKKLESESAKASVVHVVDLSGKMSFSNSKDFTFIKAQDSLADAKKVYQQTKDFALLYIPKFDLSKPEGFKIYTLENSGIEKIGKLTGIIEDRIRDLKLEAYNIDKETLKNLKTDIDLDQINVGKDGEEKASNSALLTAVGISLGVLIYIFIFVYGIQIMQGVIDEKTSKIVEVIVSSVKPFQLMLGKIVGIASVGLVQFIIWILIISLLTPLAMSIGFQSPQKQMVEEVQKKYDNSPEVKAEMKSQQSKVERTLNQLMDLKWGKIAFVFIFYFIGGYLLYGALFAAVGSAVESIQESQQFQFPITIPLIVAYLGLVLFVIGDPHGSVSVWLSMIPFTSPVIMVARVANNVPTPELVLSMVLLIGGFLFTTWIAGRIYRVGILMTGTKVSWKVLAKWFFMKG
ncbi:MAG: ABC transporter permease [Cyclobacteriaceae bacterium]|jgi:ABC-2 type transport system permease protein